MKRRTCTSRGFTLIELIATIVLIAIVAIAVGGPTLSYLGDLKAGAAAARLAADMRHARRMALSAGLKTWIAIDAANESYALYREDVENLGKASRLALSHPLDLGTNEIHFGQGAFHGVAIATVNINGGAEIEFDNFGVPHDASGTPLTAVGEVALSNGSIVRIHPVGGMAEVIP